MNMLYGLDTILQCILVVLIAVYVSWFMYKQIEFRVFKYPPGPIGIPFLGYLPFISKYKIHEDFARINKCHGEVASISAVNFRMITVADFDTAKELLCHPATLFRAPAIFDFTPGKAGFATMNGKVWVDERRYAMQAMRNVGLGRGPWNDIILEDVVELMATIGESKGQPMDIDTPLSHSAMNNMIALSMGRDALITLTLEEKECVDLANKIFKQHFQNVTLSFAFPWLLKYLVKFNLFGYKEKINVIDSAADIIRKQVVRRLQSNDYDVSSDFISQYIEEVRKQNTKLENLDFHIEACLGNIALFISGSDTAMASAHWILYFMAAYPEIQAKVHAEIDEVIGKTGIISFEDRNRLPYSMACLMEMERWVVIIPMFPPRCASETFEFHGYTISKGTTILANGWALNRDPKYWDKPDEYIPERFLENSEGKPAKTDGYAPFSFGRRHCPGEMVTLMITFLYFISILQKFTVRTPSGNPPDLSLKFCGIFEPIKQKLCLIKRE